MSSKKDGDDELPALYAVTITFSSSAQFGEVPFHHAIFLSF
jgi:AP-5 complex subunit beta-1